MNAAPRQKQKVEQGNKRDCNSGIGAAALRNCDNQPVDKDIKRWVMVVNRVIPEMIAREIQAEDDLKDIVAVG